MRTTEPLTLSVPSPERAGYKEHKEGEHESENTTLIYVNVTVLSMLTLLAPGGGGGGGGVLSGFLVLVLSPNFVTFPVFILINW